MIEVHELPKDQWPRLAQFFKDYLNDDKLPLEGSIIVAEENGKLIGVATLQKVWHIEPVWVVKKYRGKGILQQMLRLAYAAVPAEVQGVFCYTKSDRTARLIELLGLKRMPEWQVFRWLRGEN